MPKESRVKTISGVFCVEEASDPALCDGLAHPIDYTVVAGTSRPRATSFLACSKTRLHAGVVW